MPTYRLTFQRGCMGGHGACEPVTLTATDLGDLAARVWKVAARRMPDTVPDVVIDQQEGEAVATGLVYAGFDTVAKFTVQEEIPVDAVSMGVEEKV